MPPRRARMADRRSLRARAWFRVRNNGTQSLMNSALAPAQQQPASSELAAALGACRRAFVATAVFSGMSNLLMLTGALFMLEVYDRILPSRSVPTLVALLFLVAGLYAAQGMIDTIRSRILVRVGHSLDESMSGRVYDAIVRLPLKIGGKTEGTQPIRDLDNVRSFLSGSGPVAFFDLPWMPVYLAICFLFHTFIGLTALFGAIVLVALTIVTEIKTRHPTRSAAQFAVARNALLEASRRMPKRSPQWAWSAASPSIGTNSTGISSRPAGGPVTSAAASAPCRKFCACCCNRRFLRLAPGW